MVSKVTAARRQRLLEAKPFNFTILQGSKEIAFLKKKKKIIMSPFAPIYVEKKSDFCYKGDTMGSKFSVPGADVSWRCEHQLLTLPA